ncbi:type IX secretion system membrane protein PorP/SprF [Marinilongibacter aquaticus]|uniref:PorP/SprF family type IX secretion system membrane protein n=1 Tax=Marinilongibacter aquaticus TaxID=2975157 RepID=UPI0021BCFF1B|nr:type IX secretion system membrane protein PorP/SprF [Marinilongibacter aquaticus]UBM60490.1 type IX secretion system membrane protein PorP/SprF [Marinilongibacter aquaticus]
MKGLKFTLFVLFGVLGISPKLKAQQEVMYSQYMFNTLAVNPSYAGSRDVLSLTLLGRYQWIGVPGSPTTYSFTLDMPLRNEKMGLGLMAYSDAIGVARTTGLNVPYAYRMRVGQRTTLALGAQIGLDYISNNLSNVANIESSDPVFDGSNDINKIYPNAGLGFFLSNDKAYLGFSVPKIIQNKLGVYSNGTEEITQRQARHFYAMAGVVIGQGNVKIKPSTMFRWTKGTPLGFDLNVNVWLRDKIALGVSGRKSQATLSGQDVMDALVGMIELQLTPQIRVGYSYDYNMTSINGQYNANTNFVKKLTGTPTHEALLRYEFGYGKDKILTPRYF